MNTTTLTAAQIDTVLDMIDATGRTGASLGQVGDFVARALDAAGSRRGYDDPGMGERIADGTVSVLAEARARGYKRWTTGRAPHLVARIGRPA